MKTIKKADVQSKDYATYNDKIFVMFGKSCNQRDLPCGRNTR